MIRLGVVAYCLLLPAASAVAAPLPSAANDAVMTVTNATDDVNGDTSSIPALQRSPGADGISLREAMLAADNTDGSKTIRFAPELKGATIRVGSGNVQSWLPPLARGGLTIEGDIDGDGIPDITIDGSLSQTLDGRLGSLWIWSSGNVISHLRIVEFVASGITLTCVDPRCLPRSISGNRIVGNVISSTITALDAVHFGTLGLIGRSRAAAANGLTWANTEISGNTIDVPYEADSGVHIAAGHWGAAHNLVTGTKIAGNHITGARVSIDFSAGDEDAPEELKLPPPDIWPDDDRIEDTVIADNVITGFQFQGIGIEAATSGDHGDAIRRLTITGNDIFTNRTNTAGIFFMDGIWIGTASSHTSLRVTSGNVIEDVEIRGNHIKGVGNGVWISGGGKRGGAGTAGIANNRVQHVVIADNDIVFAGDAQGSDDLGPAGVRLEGGLSTPSSGSSMNAVQDVRVNGNRLTPDVAALANAKFQPAGPAGVWIIGGLSNNSRGNATGNEVSGISVVDNTILGNYFAMSTIAVRVLGGSGQGATENRVVVSEIRANTSDANAVGQRVLVNDRGATRNIVTMPAEQASATSSASPVATNTPSVTAVSAPEPPTPPNWAVLAFAMIAAIALTAGVLIARRSSTRQSRQENTSRGQ